MSDALEAKKGRRRIRVSGAVHQDHEPTPLVTFCPDDSLLGVQEIRAEILRLQRTGAGSYLFMNPALQVFVVSELRSVATVWVKERFHWLVAFYAPRTKAGQKKFNGQPYMTATVNGLTEGLEQHLIDLRSDA